MVYIFNGFKNAGNSDIYCNINETQGHYAKRNQQLQKGKICVTSLMWGFQGSPVYRGRKQNGGCQGLGGVRVNSQLPFNV